jgi:hypothetical protein
MSILSRTWKRLSRVFMPQKVSTQKVAFGQIGRELSHNGTRRSLSTEHHDVIVAQTSSGTPTDTDPRERRQSRISAVARRRTGKRHGNFKRYSVPF